MLGVVDNEPDIHNRVIKLLENVHQEIGTNEVSPLFFKSVSQDYLFVEKTPQKEVLSVEGVLKFNWPSKHFDLLPSVVLFCVPFGVDWSANEWSKRELAIQDRFTRLKSVMATREVKVIVIMIKVGSGVMDKDVLDERVSAFKRHAQTDSKTFTFFSLNDLVVENSTVRRLYKTIREGSFAYYASNIKRLKQVEKSVGDRYKGWLEQMLLARYDFKIAFFNEFQGQQNYSLRYYRQCYNNLAASLETIDEEMYDQVKIVAEIAHFKLCRLLLLQKNVEDAFQQFRNHIFIFAKLYSKYPWKHAAWVSDQFVVFCQLLDQFNVSDGLPYGDRSYYHQNAARFTIERASHFARARKDCSALYTGDETVSLLTDVNSRLKRKTFREKIFSSPRYIGAMPQILDPVTQYSLSPVEESTLELFFDFLYVQEGAIRHHDLVMRHLLQALQSLPSASSALTNSNSTGTATSIGASPRRKAILYEMIAKEEMKQGDFSAALPYLWKAVALLGREGWHQAAMPMYLAILRCATVLGRAQDYLQAGLVLYANAAYLFFSRHDLEDLHLNLRCLLHTSLHAPVATTTTKEEDKAMSDLPYVSNASVFLTTNYTPLTHRSDFGSYATDPKAVQSLLPNHHTVLVDADCKLFEITTSFDVDKVEVGQSLVLTLEIKSLFLDALCFDELAVFSFEDVVVRTFTHLASSETDGEGLVSGEEGSQNKTTAERNTSNRHLDLRLRPFQTLKVQVHWHVNESDFARFLVKDAVFGIDRVELRWKNKVRMPNDVTEERSVTFHLAAYPSDLHAYRKANSTYPAQQWSLKELYTFSQQHLWQSTKVKVAPKPPVVKILPPGHLVDLVYPSFASSSGAPEVQARGSSIVLLQGLLQRVDVVLEVGDYNLSQVKVYLSSDLFANSTSLSLHTLDLNDSSAHNATTHGNHTSSSNHAVADFYRDHALFYLPDVPSLPCHNSSSTPSKALDDVAFHPLQLNASAQPRLPLVLEGTLQAKRRVYVPLFLRAPPSLLAATNPNSNGIVRGSLKLSLEFIPRGIMTSSMLRDFTLPVQIQSPFQVQSRLQRYDVNLCTAPQASLLQKDTYVVHSDVDYVLETSLHCLATLPRSPAYPREEQSESNNDAHSDAASGVVGKKTEEVSNALRIESFSPVSALWSSSSAHVQAPHVLQMQESMRWAQSFSVSSSLSSSASAVSMGEVVVRWCDRSARPLLPPATLLSDAVQHCGYWSASSSSSEERRGWSWLLLAHPHPASLSSSDKAVLEGAKEKEAEDEEVLLRRLWSECVYRPAQASEVSVRTLAETRCALPQLQVQSSSILSCSSAVCYPTSLMILCLFVRLCVSCRR